LHELGAGQRITLRAGTAQVKQQPTDSIDSEVNRQIPF
jgi:hypothetical protein